MSHAATLNDITSILKEQNDKIIAKIDNLDTKVQQNIKLAHDDLKSQITNLYTSVNKKFVEVEADFKEVNNRLDFIERQNLMNDIMITGIPYREQEDVLQLFHVICDVLGCNKSAMVIDSIFRIPGSRDVRPIIVKFVTSMSKIEIFNLYNKNKNSTNLTLKSIGFNNADHRIYINSSLTKKNREVQKKAREHLKNGIFEKVYVSKGNIFVILKDDKSKKAKRISSMDDLQIISAGAGTTIAV